MSSFKIYNNEEQIIKNREDIIENDSRNYHFLEFSIQKNKGGPFFFGRGQGFTGAAFTVRYLTPFNKKLNIEYIIFYFDSAATSQWTSPNSIVEFAIFATNPSWGSGDHPVCNNTTDGTAGTNFFPGGALTDRYTFKNTDVNCINHGRDPRNTTTKPLGTRSYIKININKVCPPNTSISIRMEPNNIWGPPNDKADITGELYYKVIDAN